MQTQIDFPTTALGTISGNVFLKMNIEVINFYWVLWPREMLF